MAITWEQLYADLRNAYEDTRRSKVNSDAHVEFEVDLELNLFSICTAIMRREYDPGPAKRFLCEDPVKREIFCSEFYHRVVCRLLYNYIAPVLEPTFIYDSYSCQKGKGTQFGRERFQHHIRSCTRNYQYPAYMLEGDLSGYFMSIDRQILLKLVLSRIWGRLSDRNVFGECFRDVLDMDLVKYLTTLIILRDPLKDCIIIGSEEDFAGIPPQKLMQNAPPGVGLAIGDITSQLFSNVYLDVMDRYVKRVLKVKHYGRYVDDFYIISRDRQYLLHLKGVLEVFLRAELRLTLHPSKTRVVPVQLGVAFLGAMVLPFRTYVTTRTVRRFHMKMNQLERACMGEDAPYAEDLLHMRDVINSYLGHLLHFKTYNILKEQFADSPLLKYFYFDPNLQKCRISLPPDQWRYRDTMAINSRTHRGNRVGGKRK